MDCIHLQGSPSKLILGNLAFTKLNGLFFSKYEVGIRYLWYGEDEQVSKGQN